MSQIIFVYLLLIGCSISERTNVYVTKIELPTFDTIKKYNAKNFLESASIIDKDSNLVSKIEFFESGAIKSITPYTLNQIDGVYRSYFQDGSPECYLEFKSDKKHGHYFCNTPEFYLYIYSEYDERKILCEYDSTGKIIYSEICLNKKCKETLIENIPDSLNFKYVKKFLY